MSDRVFPDGFLWGASTSAYQIEGGNTSCDWAQWAAEGKAPQCGQAADSWNRWSQDLDIAEKIGLGMVRFSAEWSRIEPEPGRYDETAIAHYVDVLSDAKRRGMKTMLVLWHFTNPGWLSSANDWLWREAADRFARYAALMAERLGDLVDYWATVNEADTYAWRGHILGVWPPGRKDAWLRAYFAYRGLARGHILARRRIREILGTDAKVGFTHLLVWPHPAEKGGRLSALTIAWWDWITNRVFLDMVATETDWLGVQYYHDLPARLTGVTVEDGARWPRTDMGWRIVPRGLYEVLMRTWQRYRVPLLVTENGLADATDRQRGRFLVDHLAWLHQAIVDGVDVRGYLHWSLIDNYEWSEGFQPRFGLAAVDYRTFERSLRPSGLLYSRVISGNRLTDELGAGLVYADGSGSLGPGGK